MSATLTELRLSSDWTVTPVPLDTADPSPGANSITVPDCCHLQPFLYPDQPYWGEHIRAINRQAWLYELRFTVPALTFGRARLRFEGIDYFASVWLNGQFLGGHEGHFAPFEFDVSDVLQPTSENHLIVRVSAPWDPPNPHGTYPIDHVIRGLVKGLYEHGEGVIPPDVNPLGIWRPVWLILDAGISLERVRIQTALDGRLTLRFSATNTMPSVWRGKLLLSIDAENHQGPGRCESIPISISPGKQFIDLKVQISDPHLWWPWDQGRPDLYRLAARLVDDQGLACPALTEIFGIREVILDRSPGGFVYRINGRAVFMRGTSYMPALYLSECSTEKLAGDLDLVRQLNLNLLRVHVHVSLPRLYELCDRAGIMVWQDFELSWVHDPSLEFEVRARALQREMIDLLGNHPSIITWACHNEPTMVYSRRVNLESHPDPALYADALAQDGTRPVFLASGQADADWRRSGDSHFYFGAIWSKRYTDVYRHKVRLCSEFGVEAPAAPPTLQAYPECWSRLQHLLPAVEELWKYQAELIQFNVEHFRRLRSQHCAGYVHFWLADLVPQVGWGILDSARRPKGGFDALRQASAPLLISLEHDGRSAKSLWLFNDTPESYPDCTAICRIYDANNRLRFEQHLSASMKANCSERIARADWPVPPALCHRIELILQDSSGIILARNTYHQPFQPRLRPQGYPWKFDRFLGCKVYASPGASSLVDQSNNPYLKVIPLSVREQVATIILRQRLPAQFLTIAARIIDRLNA